MAKQIYLEQNYGTFDFVNIYHSHINCSKIDSSRITHEAHPQEFDYIEKSFPKCPECAKKDK